MDFERFHVIYFRLDFGFERKSLPKNPQRDPDFSAKIRRMKLPRP